MLPIFHRTISLTIFIMNIYSIIVKTARNFLMDVSQSAFSYRYQFFVPKEN